MFSHKLQFSTASNFGSWYRRLGDVFTFNPIYKDELRNDFAHSSFVRKNERLQLINIEFSQTLVSLK